MKQKNALSEGITPLLIEGGIAVDDRGELGFINNFDMSTIKRFYTVTNHQQGFIRAWHAHRREGKYVVAVQGAALVAAVQIDNWDDPSKDAKVHRYVLSSKKPAILYIPPGFANGFKSLTPDAKLIFFSTDLLQESQNDDIRYDSHYWDPWSIIER
jgi:dTDP-4-dehydrorhamnose 3,5-epimerase